MNSTELPSEAPVDEGEASTGARLGNTDDLPPDLLKQLRGFTTSEEDDAVITVLDNCLGGSGSIDEIMVALYRQSGTVHDRKTLATRLTRMVKKEKLGKVPTKRGHYMTKAA